MLVECEDRNENSERVACESLATKEAGVAAGGCVPSPALCSE